MMNVHWVLTSAPYKERATTPFNRTAVFVIRALPETERPVEVKSGKLIPFVKYSTTLRMVHFFTVS